MFVLSSEEKNYPMNLDQVLCFKKREYKFQDRTEYYIAFKFVNESIDWEYDSKEIRDKEHERILDKCNGL